MGKNTFSLARINLENVLSPETFVKASNSKTASGSGQKKAVTKKIVLDTLKKAGIVNDEGFLTPSYTATTHR